MHALLELAANRPIDPNDTSAWVNDDAHAAAVLRRHGIADVSTARLELRAARQLAAGQAERDSHAGLDWSRVTAPAHLLDDQLREAHAQLPIDLDDPSVWVAPADRRRAVARGLGLDPGAGDQLSHWALADLERFDAEDLRCWRIASPTWIALADQQLPPVDRIERPVGVLLAPAPSEGWDLTPTFSMDAMRFLVALGATIERDLRAAVLPAPEIPTFVTRWNQRTLHAGPRENVDSRNDLAEALTRELGLRVDPGAPDDAVDRWGRVVVRRSSHTANGR